MVARRLHRVLLIGLLTLAAPGCGPAPSVLRVENCPVPGANGQLPPEAPSFCVPSKSAVLTMDATGLGPCDVQWYVTCNYGIRVEGPDGYDHRGNFVWDEGVAPPGQEPAHGPIGPVASTNIQGDIPGTLGPGEWTISFRLWYGSDAIQLVPVVSGTPRAREEDPFTAACSTRIDTANAVIISLHVAFQGHACTVETELETRKG